MLWPAPHGRSKVTPAPVPQTPPTPSIEGDTMDEPRKSESSSSSTSTSTSSLSSTSSGTSTGSTGCSTSSGSDVDKQSLICVFGNHIMEQPVLLACLHSCCMRCSKQQKLGDVVRCGTCQEDTSFSKLQRNGLLFDRIRAVHASRGEAKCDFCDQSEKTDHPAEAHCSECNKFLCAQCIVQHRKFLPGHGAKFLSSMASSGEKFITGSCPCRDHPGVMCDYLCWNCQQPQCQACMVVCQDKGHHTKSILSSLPVMKNELSAAHKQLASRASAIEAIQNIGVEASESRRALAAILLRNKRRLLEDIDHVFDEAKELLNGLSDEIDLTASKSISLALDLQRKSEDALSYCEVLRNRDDVRYLVQQRRLVLDRLQLLDREVTSLIAAAQLPRVEINSFESSKLLEAIRSYIGTPQSVEAEEPRSEFCKFSRIEESAWSVGGLLCGRDISLTLDGNVFIALGHLGLKEFDDKSRELSHWRPSKCITLAAEEVRSVEALRDGLVVVGLQLLGCVTILKRSPVDSKRWIENRRIMEGLRGAPYSMSASIDMLVIAEGRKDEIRTPKPSREIVVISLSGGAVTSRRTWEYELSCVAASSEFICTASEGKVCTASTGQTVRLSSCAPAASFVVDAYRYQIGRDDAWTFIWRYEHDGYKVSDMCLYSETLTNRLLFVSDCGRVFIVAADRGAKQSVMFESETSDQNAVRLAASSQPFPQMALLFRDGKARVYSP